MTSRRSIIWAIAQKDLREFIRDPFYLLMTLLGLITYVVIFWLLPQEVDETLEVGVYPPAIAQLVEQIEVGAGAEEGLAVTSFADPDQLSEAVTEGQQVAGVEFPASFLIQAVLGQPSPVTVYIGSGVSEAVETVIGGLVREMAFALAGEGLPVSLPVLEQVVLGEDRAGDQISIRERIRPLLAFFILLLEMLALAGLVSSEIHTRTATALLVTPARVPDLLAAKSLLGTALAFGQAVLLMAAIGSLGSNPFTLLLLLLLGAWLITGFGLLAGSAGSDFISIIFLGMLIMFPLAIPAVGILFPGTAAWWVQALPSWGLADGLHRITTYGETFAEILPQLTLLASWGVVAFVAGWWVLSRRVVRL